MGFSSLDGCATGTLQEIGPEHQRERLAQDPSFLIQCPVSSGDLGCLLP